MYNFKPLKTCKKIYVFYQPFCPPTTTPVVSACLPFSVNCSLSNISIYDALWKLYLRFLQQCCRGFTMTFYNAVFPPFQHTNYKSCTFWGLGLSMHTFTTIFHKWDKIVASLPTFVSSQSISPASHDYCVLLYCQSLSSVYVPVQGWTAALWSCCMHSMVNTSFFWKWHQNLLLCYYFHIQHLFWYLYFFN